MTDEGGEVKAAYLSGDKDEARVLVVLRLDAGLSANTGFSGDEGEGEKRPEYREVGRLWRLVTEDLSGEKTLVDWEEDEETDVASEAVDDPVKDWLTLSSVLDRRTREIGACTGGETFRVEVVDKP